MFSRLVLQAKVGQGIAANLVVSCGGGVAKYLLWFSEWSCLDTGIACLQEVRARVEAAFAVTFRHLRPIDVAFRDSIFEQRYENRADSSIQSL